MTISDKKGKKEEDLLIKLANEHNDFSENDKIILNKMISEGLIDKEGGGYFLTKYGEMIRVMGYKIHLRTEEFEKTLPLHTSKKKQIIAVALGLVFLLVVFLLVLGVYAVAEF